jgi:hypothetical protein
VQGSVRITAKTVSVVRATNEPLIPTESTVNLKGNQFIAWYCSEPRLAFNGIVVVRYRLYLESPHLAANTINQQLSRARIC